MSFTLRSYQKQAVDATLAHFRHSTSAACVVLPTGAGKSLIIAELCRLAKGRVLVLCHVKELCEQNFLKYKALTEPKARESTPPPASESTARSVGLFSAGLGQKQSQCHVTFGSIQSVAGHVQQFDSPYSLLIIDECHRVSMNSESQYATVIKKFREKNPRLSVLGLTATPYRLGLGWCFQKHAWGMIRTDEVRPFEMCVFEVTLKQMLEGGYLTRPRLFDAPVAQYNFGESGAENDLLVRHKRVTESIIEQVVSLTEAQGRRGVMIFAATVEHAKEILGYLPEGQAALIVGETDNNERDEKVRAFVEQRLRFLVNVAVLTTGFDAPHVDFIAILRKTESVSLFQQIVGRGLRLYPEKEDCLVIDYAGNGYDLFSPEIGEAKPHADSTMVKVPCPECSYENDFWGHQDAEGHILEHYGRRCHGLSRSQDGKTERCTYRFRFKECPHCNAENDIAARRCADCDAAIVDPDDMLKNALRLKDALVLRVSGMQFQAKDETLTITYHDEDGASVKERFNFGHQAQRAIFNRVFSRRIASGRHPLVLETAAQALQLSAAMPVPDFVVARAQKLSKSAKWYKVVERVFDYQGAFRKAAAAD